MSTRRIVFQNMGSLKTILISSSTQHRYGFEVNIALSLELSVLDLLPPTYPPSFLIPLFPTPCLDKAHR